MLPRPAIPTALLCASLAASAFAPGLAATGGKNAPAIVAAEPSPDRIVLLAADSPEYLALAIPRSFKTAPSAPLHLLVFKGGLCVRDHGLGDTSEQEGRGVDGAPVVEQSGTNQRAYVAEDDRTAVVVGTRYVSRVDVTPGNTSTANDTVTGATTLTWVDPEHPDGRWRVTLENSRWAKDVIALAGAKGVVVTTFVPRNGPNDVRILDANGRETARVREAAAETQSIVASEDGAFVAAEVRFPDKPKLPARGVIVFDVARGSQWTYGWRYGSDDEPLSWSLETGGVLVVKLPGVTRRFDATGRQF